MNFILSLTLLRLWYYTLQYLHNFLSGLQLSDLLQLSHLLNTLVRVELSHPNTPEDDLEQDEGHHEDDLSLLIDPPGFLHLVHFLATLSEECVPELVTLLIIVSSINNASKSPHSLHGKVVFIRSKLFHDVYRDVSVVDHDHHDDVEGVGEEVVNHLEIGGLGNHGVDAALDVGDDDHGGDGDHDSVLIK